jgi:hypothetical protein
MVLVGTLAQVKSTWAIRVGRAIGMALVETAVFIFLLGFLVLNIFGA